MKLNRLLLFCLFVPLLPAAALAEPIACPDLATAQQIATCPSEEELQFTFTGFCSDNARIYNWHEESVCTDYPLYRRLKNVALWETAGGDFQAYLSCDLAPEQIKAAKPARIAVASKGKLTRVICSYGPGIEFVLRTKARCTVAGSGDCRADPAGCRATCD